MNMKKAIAGVLGLVAFMALTVAASAATQVMKGTPVIDGKMDAAYGKTIAIPEDYTKVFCGSSVDWSAAPTDDTDARSTSYLLYDDNNIYVFNHVTDADVEKNEAATAPPENPWDQDATENWMDLGNGVLKASVSPFVGYVFGQGTDIDLASCKFAWAKTATGYDTEVAIPASLTKGGTISYVLQLNDYQKDGFLRCFGAQQGGVVEYTLGDVAK
jgi:hypothetical protein